MFRGQLAIGGVLGLTVLYWWVGGTPVQGKTAGRSAPPELVARRDGREPALRFPLAGAYQLTDSFGDPRGRGRRHAGVDIMSAKLTPVHAVASGRVRWIEGEDGGDHVALALVHDNGWRSYYMHLNNDTPGTDDGRGRGIADDITFGARVEAGQLLGWVGDSGNAERTAPHLHFELRDPSGNPVDPYLSLSAAERHAAQ